MESKEQLRRPEDVARAGSVDSTTCSHYGLGMLIDGIDRSLCIPVWCMGGVGRIDPQRRL